MDSFVKEIAAVFKMNANDGNARQMESYMKNKVRFYGIKTPLREELSKPYLRKGVMPGTDMLPDVMSALWEYPYRELHYFGLTLMEKQAKHLEEPFLLYLEGLVQEKPWWDTVDFIAARIAGRVLYRMPGKVEEYGMRWVAHENMWVNRMGLIFQLKFKGKTNEYVLFNNCSKLKGSEGFFIQKAIGWALREYSKTNPVAVKKFIDKEKLKPLSTREGLKIIGKQEGA